MLFRVPSRMDLHESGNLCHRKTAQSIEQSYPSPLSRTSDSNYRLPTRSAPQNSRIPSRYIFPTRLHQFVSLFVTLYVTSSSSKERPFGPPNLTFVRFLPI